MLMITERRKAKGLRAEGSGLKRARSAALHPKPLALSP
jgi:hypothetical protein